MALSAQKVLSAGDITINPKELFVEGLRKEFAKFVEPLMQISERNAPTTILAKMEDYIWCVLGLLNHFEDGDLDVASQCVQLLASIQNCQRDPKSLSRKYLDDYFAKASCRVI